MVDREMTLDEWVEKLSPSHSARVELVKIRAEQDSGLDKAKEANRQSSMKVRECARELDDLASHPETRVTGGDQRVRAFEIAAKRLHDLASELFPWLPRKFS